MPIPFAVLAALAGATIGAGKTALNPETRGNWQDYLINAGTGAIGGATMGGAMGAGAGAGAASGIGSAGGSLAGSIGAGGFGSALGAGAAGATPLLTGSIQADGFPDQPPDSMPPIPGHVEKGPSFLKGLFKDMASRAGGNLVDNVSGHNPNAGQKAIAQSLSRPGFVPYSPVPGMSSSFAPIQFRGPNRPMVPRGY